MLTHKVDEHRARNIHIDESKKNLCIDREYANRRTDTRIVEGIRELAQDLN